MPRAHVIETLSFEVDFGSEAEARDQHGRLGDFVAGRGLKVIGEVFDEFAGAEEVLRLDRLEIDLGVTRLTANEADAEQRLRDALRRALREALAGRRPTAARDAQDTLADQSHADLEMVWGYLHHGRLSWRADAFVAVSFDDLVMRVLEKHGEAFVTRLRASPVRAHLLARIARQWPTEALQKVAALLSLADVAVALGWATASRPAGRPEMPTGPGSAPARPWERLLSAMAAAPDPRRLQMVGATPPPGITRRADGRETGDLAWSSLMLGEPADVRARLRALGRDADWRGRLLPTLTETRWRQLLRQWGSPGDAELFLGLIAHAAPWRLGATAGADAVAQVLGKAILEHLLAGDRQVLGAPSGVRTLVEARARMDGLAPDRTASALMAGWPSVGPSAYLRASLRLALSSWIGVEDSGSAEHPDALGRRPARARIADAPIADEAAAGEAARDQARAAASPAVGTADERWRWRLEVDVHLARGALPGPAWEAALRLEPAWLSARLREHGRVAAWRRAFARALSPVRLGELLSLWAQPAEAAFIQQLVETPDAWVLDAPHTRQAIGARLREWLLDDLLLADRERFDEAALVTSLVQRRAEYDDLEPARVARDLGAAWPRQGVAGAHHARLLRILASLQGPAGPLPVNREKLAVQERVADGGFAAARAAARTRVEVALAARVDADLVAVVRERLAADGDWLRAELRERGHDQAFRRWLVDALPPSVLFELAQPWLSETAVRIILAAGPDASAAPAFWSDVFDTLLSSARSDYVVRRLLLRRLRDASAQDRTARGSALRAVRPFVRDALPADARPGAAEPSIARWLDGLPDRPGVPLVRGLVSLLAPASAGLRQIADLNERQRRDLLLRLRPAEGAIALQTTELLSRLLRVSGLPPPRESLEGFNWRHILREFFEEGRRFDVEGFAARWFTDLLREAPSGAHADWRAALLAALAAERPESAVGPTQPKLGARPHEDPKTHGDPAAHLPVETPVPTAPLPDAASPAMGPPRSPPDGPRVRRAILSGSPRGPSPANLTAGPALEAPEPVSALVHDTIAAALERVRPAPEAQAGVEPWLNEHTDAAEPAIDDTLYVANAGIVLAGPYLPTLFGRLDLTRDGRFIDENSAERAAHLLQFMVDGGEAAPEHHLTLNKLLCGIDLAAPIGRDFTILDHERQAIEGLLRAMLDRWTAVGRTSVAGLRESFFQRQGALTLLPEAWRLLVEPRAFDMLLDQLPWGFSTLKFPWMAQVLYVDWR